MPDRRTTERVTRRDPCPICDRPDWCLVASDGRYAICMRVESTRPAKGNCGGWIHRLDGGTHGAGPERVRPGAPQSSTAPIASIGKRHIAYSRLFGAATLGGKHTKELRARGFSPDDITARGYRSLHLRGRSDLAGRCAREPNDLVGVPGFYVAEGDTGRYWTLAGSPGLLIPCRDSQGRIRAVRIRPDEPRRGEGKYRWLSSPDRPGGTGSGVHCHVARPATATTADVWIVEGELKADFAATALGATVISIPGVASWPLALDDLAELLPDRGKVVVAMDADWRSNPQVHNAAWSLLQTCNALGYCAEVALWAIAHKGLDDLLAAGLNPQRTGAAGMKAPEWTLKISSRVLAPHPPAATDISMPGLTEMREKLRRAMAKAIVSPCPSA